MPIHEYICEKCGSKFEVLTLSMKEADEKLQCPKCGTECDKTPSTYGFIVHGFNTSNGYSGNMR